MQKPTGWLIDDTEKVRLPPSAPRACLGAEDYVYPRLTLVSR